MIEAKISELSSFPICEEKDYLLKSEKQFDEDGALNLKQPYTSHRIEVSAFIETMLSRERTISAEWNFLSAPEQRVRLDIWDFINKILLNKTNRDDAINLSGGFYTNISNGFNGSMVDPLDISTYSIANIDYVNRIAALVYAALRELVDTYANIEICQSNIGDVIHTTTLNTEDKVRDVFGMGREIFRFGDIVLTEPDTHWTLTAQNKIIAGTNSASEIGTYHINSSYENGTDITVNKFLNHQHTIKKSHSQSVGLKASYSSQKGVTSITSGGPNCVYGYRWKDGLIWKIDYGSTTGVTGYTPTIGTPTVAITGSTSSSDTSKNQTSSNPINQSGVSSGSINIEQAYKDVFVWKRTA